ncbi:TPA: hypothetical protein ACFI8A_002257, partial [Neisseria gonorrhoeae]
MNRHSRRFPPTPPISANPADFVIPADFRHSRESGNPETPNAAGIYRKRLKPDGPDSRLRGNHGGRVGGSNASARRFRRHRA